jgi:hypothetical protein
MTAVAILANVQYTVFTFDHNPNLSVAKTKKNVSYTCSLVYFVV